MKSFNFRYAAGFLILMGVFALAYFTSRKPISTVAAPRIEWKSFNEGAALAQNSRKKILVDVYTNWCSWCKKMDADVFTNNDIVNLVEQNFIPVKLNAESNAVLSFKGNSYTEARFAHELGVSGYPTILFFDQDCNAITDFPGYAPPERFAQVLSFIGKDYYKTISFQEYVQRQPAHP